ncbi:SixA phosphatase family protein [Thiohalobacter thiocyanaticus]|uniref:Histidine phosphatase family protein n=1 Tax=Thiohalobacter thiocyanaticus TaxID=585455 RepID=A0A426QDY4_9GAMM|nr:histidine phosphatase family protein [Thiohalobacter thiocyanaticus]RRQ19970.1 histidine phosphatase family protein [Thiohalobacter thiocyanaticus]
MSKTLALLRHAKSDWDAGTTDIDRPLNKRGKKDAPSLGRWLQRQAWRPQLILSSPAVRARQTIEAVIEQAGMQDVELRWEEELYLASRKSLLQRIRGLSQETKSVLLVGHNPGLEEVLEYLSRTAVPTTDSDKLFTTANLALLRLDGNWKDAGRGTAELVELVRPRDLG